MDEKALRNIIQRIESEANRKIEEFRMVAESRRKEMLEKANEELEKELRELRLRYEREIENTVNYILSQAKIKGRRLILEEREKGINAVFSEVLRRAAGDGRYRGYLERSLREAKEALGSGTVFCREEDMDVLKSMLPPDFTLQPALAKSEAGIVVHSKDGKKILDLRPSRVIEDMKGELRKDVSSVLYGGAL